MIKNMFLVQAGVSDGGEIIESSDLKKVLKQITGVPEDVWQKCGSDSGQVLISEHYMKCFKGVLSGMDEMSDDEFIDSVLSEDETIELISDELGLDIFSYKALL